MEITMNDIKKILFYSSLVFRANFWTIRDRYDKTIDAFINDIVDRDIEGKFSSCSVKYGDVEIWIENYPYSYGTVYYPTGMPGRPSLYTIYKFKKFINAKRFRRNLNRLKNKSDLLSVDRIAHKMFVEK